MIGLVAAVELWVQRHPATCLPAEGWDGLVSARAAEKRARGCRVLCLGDSMVKLSVVPRPIAREAGGRAHNLAVCGSHPILGYLLLRRALEAGAQPEAVLIGYSTRGLQRPPEETADQWSALMGPRDWADLARRTRDPALLASLVLRGALPTLQNRHVLRGRIGDALAGQADPNLRVLTRFVRNWSLNDGAQVMPSNTQLRDYPLDVAGVLKDWYDPRPWHPANAADLRRLLDLAASHGIRVYWLQTPALSAVQSACEANGWDEGQTARLRAWMARYPNFSVIDARRAGYEPGVFMDPNHLGREGAYAYSLALADVLRAPHATGRWIDLPAYRERPTDPTLEQVELPIPAVAATPAGAARR
jgi:hypothetical protein